MIKEHDESLYKPSRDGAIWREWDGFFVAYSHKDDATHLLDPIACLVFEDMLKADGSVAFSDLISSIQRECGDDFELNQATTLLDEVLKQLQNIGLVEITTACQ